MKKRILSLLIVILVTLTGCYTQNVVTVRSVNNDISENLDLEAVAAIFGESTNLEDFEARLNDPQNHISNLDLNQDGYVDYIRVVESMENGVYLITLQDVLGNDQYQDIATIDVGRNSEGYVLVEIIGDPYFYGPNYIIQPIYNTRPVIYSIFWNPYHRFWVSPYYWNYYPHYFQPWRPYTIINYRSHISRYRMSPQYYRYMHARAYNYGDRFHNKIFRNDYEKRNPNRGFEHRNNGYKNARDLYQKRNNFNHNVRPNTPNERRQVPNRNIKQQPVRVNKEAPKYRGAPVTKEKSPVYNNERPVKPTEVKTSGNRVQDNKKKVSKKERIKKEPIKKIKQDKKVKKDKEKKREHR